eukprot:687676-Pelagomonas_calceolata.AAC.1
MVLVGCGALGLPGPGLLRSCMLSSCNARDLSSSCHEAADEEGVAAVRGTTATCPAGVPCPTGALCLASTPCPAGALCPARLRRAKGAAGPARLPWLSIVASSWKALAWSSAKRAAAGEEPCVGPAPAADASAEGVLGEGRLAPVWGLAGCWEAGDCTVAAAAAAVPGLPFGRGILGLKGPKGLGVPLGLAAG